MVDILIGQNYHHVPKLVVKEYKNLKEFVQTLNQKEMEKTVPDLASLRK